MLKTLTEISYIRQKGLLKETKEGDETIIKKTLLDIGTVIDGSFTFGTGITAFLPGVKNLLEGEMPYLSEQSIILLYITAMWIILNRHKDKVTKLINILKEEGLGETLNKVVSFLKSLEDVGLKVANEVGYAASNIADVGAFTFLAFPILDATLYLIGNDTITLDNPSAYLKSVLISIGILSVKNIFNSVIKKIKTRFGTLEEGYVLPNDEGISRDVFSVIKKTLLESSSQTWFLPEELDVTRTYVLGEEKYDVELKIGREVIKEKYILEIKTGNNNNILINLQINPLHEPRIYEEVHKVLVECVSRFNYESKYPILLKEEPDSSHRFKRFLDNENLNVTIPLTKEALCSIPGQKWCSGWLMDSGRLSRGTVYVIRDKRDGEKYIYHHQGKVPMLLDSESFTLFDAESRVVNHRKFMSKLPEAMKAFGLKYGEREKIKYTMDLPQDEIEEYASFNDFSKEIYKFVSKEPDIDDAINTIDSFLGESLTIPDSNQVSHYTFNDNQVEVEEWGIKLFINKEEYETDFLKLSEDDDWFFHSAITYPHGDHYEEIDSDELNYGTCWFSEDIMQRMGLLFEKLGHDKHERCGEYDDGEMNDFFEMYFPDEWDDASRRILDTLGYGVGENRAKETMEMIDDETLFEFEQHGQYYVQNITWIQLLYLIHNYRLTNLSELLDKESNELDMDLNEAWYDSYDWDNETSEDLDTHMEKFLDTVENIDVKPFLDGMNYWETLVRKIENIPSVTVKKLSDKLYDGWTPLYTITLKGGKVLNIHEINFREGTLGLKDKDAFNSVQKSYTVSMENLIPNHINTQALEDVESNTP